MVVLVGAVDIGAVVAVAVAFGVVVVFPAGTVTTTCVHSIQFNGKSLGGKFCFLCPVVGCCGVMWCRVQKTRDLAFLGASNR